MLKLIETVGSGWFRVSLKCSIQWKSFSFILSRILPLLSVIGVFAIFLVPIRPCTMWYIALMSFITAACCALLNLFSSHSFLSLWQLFFTLQSGQVYFTVYSTLSSSVFDWSLHTLVFLYSSINFYVLSCIQYSLHFPLLLPIIS